VPISIGTSGVVQNAFNGVLQFAMVGVKKIVFDNELMAGEELGEGDCSSTVYSLSFTGCLIELITYNLTSRICSNFLACFSLGIVWFANLQNCRGIHHMSIFRIAFW
jgi:hypothetical protein